MKTMLTMVVMVVMKRAQAQQPPGSLTSVQGRICCLGETPSSNCAVNNDTQEDLESYIHWENGTRPVNWQAEQFPCPDGHISQRMSLNDSGTQSESYIKGYADRLVLVWHSHVLHRRTENFCVDSTSHQAVVCDPKWQEVCSEKSCVNHCCEEGQYLTDIRDGSSHAKCQYSNNTSMSVKNAPNQTAMRHPLSNCWNAAAEYPSNSVSEYSITNGKLVVSHNKTKTYEHDEYCLFAIHDRTEEYGVLRCLHKKEKVPPPKPSNTLILILVSVTSLILLLLVYLCLPGLMSNQGRCVFCYMLALLLAYFSTLAYKTSEAKPKEQPITCKIIGLFIQFAWLSVYSWLTVICYDIMQTIRATAMAIPLAKLSASFRGYWICGWGFPLLLTVLMASLLALPDRLTGSARPSIGKDGCCFTADSSQWYYFFGPVVVLIVSDLLMLGCTTYLLSKNTCLSPVRRASPSTDHTSHISAFSYRLCLFVMMLLSLGSETIVYASDSVLWDITNIINSLQGFLLLILFLMNKKKRQLVGQYFTNHVKLCLGRSAQGPGTWALGAPTAIDSASSHASGTTKKPSPNNTFTTEV